MNRLSPKEKASQLIEQAKKYAHKRVFNFIYGPDDYMANVKAIALIAATEAANESNFYKYWQEVRREIEEA